MKYIILLAVFFSVTAAYAEELSPFERWHTFECSVRDQKIPHITAEKELPSLMAALSSYTSAHYTLSSAHWCFPLQGYTLKALSKKDFQPNINYGPAHTKGYNFFDGNKHGGHPAYDIFIRDKNRDTLDDKTHQPVRAVAMTDSVVLSINTGWTKKSDLRGGNYVWLYAPQRNQFFYYAHLKEVLVHPGEYIPRGGIIGTVGRTGVLAARKASPTHVHLMVLDYKDGTLVPYNYYKELK